MDAYFNKKIKYIYILIEFESISIYLDDYFNIYF